MTLAGEPVDMTLLVAGLLDLHSMRALACCSKGLSRLISDECTVYRWKREAFDAAASGDFGPAIRGNMQDVLRCVIAHPSALRNLTPFHPDERRRDMPTDDVSVLLQQYHSFLDNKRVGKTCCSIGMPQFPPLHIISFIDRYGPMSRRFYLTLRQKLRRSGGADIVVYLYKESIIAPP